MRKIKLNKDTEMTVDVIKYVLDIHKEEAKRINKLKDYYNNNNDIVHREYNNGNKPKNKISNPYASYITNTAVGYFLGKPVSYTNIENFETINDLLVYNDEADNNTTLANMIKYKGYSKEKIVADSSEPKSIDDIKRQGIYRIKGAKKGKDSILNGIQFIQDFKIYVHPKCENTIVELSNYVWDTKEGNVINKPIDDYNHLMDALRYSLEDVRLGGVKFDRNRFNL